MRNLPKRKKVRTRTQRLLRDLLLFLPVLLIWLIPLNFPHLTPLGAYRALETENLNDHISKVTEHNLATETEPNLGVCRAFYGKSDGLFYVGTVQQTSSPFWSGMRFEIFPNENILSLASLIEVYCNGADNSIVSNEGWYAVVCADPAVASVELTIVCSIEWRDTDGNSFPTQNEQVFFCEEVPEGTLWLTHYNIPAPEPSGNFSPDSISGMSATTYAGVCRAYDADGNLLYEYTAP